MKLTVEITLKPGVLDPEARMIENALAGLGYADILGIRTGKHITLDLDENDLARARQKAAKIAETLLVNSVIEDYTISVSPANISPTNTSPANISPATPSEDETDA